MPPVLFSLLVPWFRSTNLITHQYESLHRQGDDCNDGHDAIWWWKHPGDVSPIKERGASKKLETRNEDVEVEPCFRMQRLATRKVLRRQSATDFKQVARNPGRGRLLELLKEAFFSSIEALNTIKLKLLSYKRVQFKLEY